MRLGLMMVVLPLLSVACSGVVGDDVHCLCPYPEARLLVTHSGGQPITKITLGGGVSGGTCAANKKGTECRFDAADGHHEITIRVEGFKPYVGKFAFTSGRHESVCQCGWRKVAPATVVLESLK